MNAMPAWSERGGDSRNATDYQNVHEVDVLAMPGIGHVPQPTRLVVLPHTHLDRGYLYQHLWSSTVCFVILFRDT